MTTFLTTGALMAAIEATINSAMQDSLYGNTKALGGVQNAYTLTPVPAITAYATGQSFVVTNGIATNNAASTLAVSGLAAKPIVDRNNAALVGGELPLNGAFLLVYDGTSFRVMTHGLLPADIDGFDTQVQTSRLDQMAVPTADVSMNTNKITDVTDPAAAQDAATKNYVDTLTVNDLTAPTADFSMNTNKITDVTDPAAAQDAATKNYVDTLTVNDLTAPAAAFDMNSNKITSLSDGSDADDACTVGQAVKYKKVQLSAANIAAAYATPVEVIPTPGAGKFIKVLDVVMRLNYGTTTYASGTAAGLQYGTTVHGAGTMTHADCDALVKAVASKISSYIGTALTAVDIADIQDKSVCFSNATAAYDTGDGTLDIEVAYMVM